MTGVLFSTVAFILALGVLITVHEFGHYWVAKRCGVRVLRFSVGFGRPIWRYQRTEADTEYVVGAIPLGGYVKMLDEREGNVPPEQLHLAFNRKPVLSRIAVVIAGPLFNFLFAIAAYWSVFVMGVPGTAPVVGTVLPDSIAERSGFIAGDKIVEIDGTSIPTWQAVTTELVSQAISGGKSTVVLERANGQSESVDLDLAGGARFIDEGVVFMEAIGMSQWPETLPAVIGGVKKDFPAYKAGIRAGDEVVSVDGNAVSTWAEWVDYVAMSSNRGLDVKYRRDGETFSAYMRPVLMPEDESKTPRVGVVAQFPRDLLITWSTGPIDGMTRAIAQTYKMSISTLTMLWKMVVGQASLKNISGPLKIAEVAGDSANAGITAFLQFLALISVSLGVLNLLPIPVLDGGHLLFYIVELFTRRPVSERVQLAGQQVGIMLLVMLMGVAFFNDISGILSRIQ